MLISSMVGMDLRTTMDMDATIKGFSLTEENLKKILQEIVMVDVNDEVKFILDKIETIRDDEIMQVLKDIIEESCQKD